MKIGTGTGGTPNIRQGNRNGGSEDVLATLEKQKNRIEQQIKKIEKSDEPADVKKTKIKQYEEELQAIGKQELEEKARQIKNGTEAIVSETPEASDENENPQAVNKNVMKGMISASDHLKTGKVAYKSLKEAELKGDTGRMEKAMSYLVPELQKAEDGKKIAQKGMEEYKNAVRNAEKKRMEEDTKNNGKIVPIQTEKAENKQATVVNQETVASQEAATNQGTVNNREIIEKKETVPNQGLKALENQDGRSEKVSKQQQNGHGQAEIKQQVKMIKGIDIKV